MTIRLLGVATLVGWALACAPSRPGSIAPPPVAPGLARGLATADSLIAAAVDRQFPGAVLVVAKDGRVVRERAFGHAQRNDYDGRPVSGPRLMRTSTLFDLASVTKVMATTFAVMLLADRGQLDVDAPVSRYLTDFRGPHLDSITVRHLLTHSSGLVQWQPLYYHAANKAQTYAVIRDMPLGWGVGAGRHYSDLGFMLLGDVVETVAGVSLDRFVERELYGPLGLRSTTFNPKTRGFTDFAATEAGNGYERHMVYDPNFGYDYAGDPAAWDGWRRYVLEGEVNDGNAWHANGGVAGHAGLFSTAADLRILLDLLNDRGVHDGRRYIRAETVDRFLTRDAFQHYLGWMFPRGLPEGSFAHNGFTGTYVIGIPTHRLSIVLLTNRQNVGTDARGFFPDIGSLQQAVVRAIVDGADADASSR
jgi:serine-type D-Ala-D-Ala carboxypeptidase